MRTRTTCPRDCYDACGVVVERNERRLFVRGDPDHAVARGRLCGKCAVAYNGVLQDPGARLSSPLRRTGPKGEGRFEAVSWDEALGEVAARLRTVVDTNGGSAITNVHYTGTLGLLGYAFGLRLTQRLGVTEVDPDTVCNMAGHQALGYVYGTSTDGFDPRTARDSSCIVVWGANPSATAPHAHEHWLTESPASVVVVDPVATPTARTADLHLQPFPGTDAALAFALLHVIRREGLVDRAFVADRTLGWDELEPLVEPCTPAWAQERTGVAAPLIEEAARLYAPGPSLLWMGQGLQRQSLGGNIARAVATLPAVTGNLGRPGAGILYLNGPESRGMDLGYLVAAHLAADAPTIGHMGLAEHLEDPARSQALLCWNMNPAASNPEQERLRRALRRDDLFTVAIDLFPTDTTDHADIVLPAASFLECDDLVTSYFNLSLSAQVRVLDPPGEAQPNSEIFRRLAAALGLTDPELFEPDDVVIATLLERSGAGLTFAELSEVGTTWPSAEPVVQFASGVFPTPSGRVELASATAEGHGHPRTPLPLVDQRPGGGRLRLLSPASRWLMNSSFGNDAHIARLLGPPTVGLHPDDAAALDLLAGQQVQLDSGIGSLVLRLEVSNDVPRGVAYSPKGRWPRLEDARANINALVAGREADMGRSTCVHGTEVTVRPAGRGTPVPQEDG